MYFKERLQDGTDAMKKWEGKFRVKLMDRTGILSNDRDIITPIPEVAEVGTFSEVADQRAKDIIALGKPIRVMYSGGLDSTTALIALIKNGATDVEVLMTEASKQEYPQFFEQHIDGKLNYRIFDKEVEAGHYAEFVQENDNDFVLVTGEIGDQLFGSARTLENIEIASKTIDWSGEYDGLQKLCEACPMPVETYADLFWWANFTLKYQWVQLRIFRNLDIDFNRIYHFFDSTEFQQWALQTPMLVKMPDFDALKYKQPIRDYILDFTGDAEYATKKKKLPSLRGMYYQGKKECISINTNFNKEYLTQVVTERVEGRNAEGKRTFRMTVDWR
jgi:hypothetical protein